MHREQIESIERSLREIVGVQSARIRTDGEEVTEVHIVVGPNRRAKGVVRDALSTLFVRHGISLHHHKVSVVATTGRGLEEAEPLPPARRLLFRSVNVYREGNHNEAQVELVDGGRVVTGTAAGPAVRHSQEKLVARAALQAVSRLFGDGVALELVGLERNRVGNRSVVLSHVVLLRSRSETHLIGSALVGTDSLEATVFSVLDALNRVLPTLAGEDTVEYEVEEYPPEAVS